MPLWKAILVSVGAVVVLGVLLPEEVADPIGLLLLLVSSVWVYRDAKKIQTYKYVSLLGTSPWVLAIFTFLLWILVFPGYLYLKYRIEHNMVALKKAYQTGGDGNLPPPSTTTGHHR